jgi:hypothetical protein
VLAGFLIGVIIAFEIGLIAYRFDAARSASAGIYF